MPALSPPSRPAGLVNGAEAGAGELQPVADSRLVCCFVHGGKIFIIDTCPESGSGVVASRVFSPLLFTVAQGAAINTAISPQTEGNSTQRG